MIDLRIRMFVFHILKNRECCHNCILPTLAILAVTALPVVMFQAEDYFKRQQVLLMTV